MEPQPQEVIYFVDWEKIKIVMPWVTPLVGVIVGAFLSPLVNHFISKWKRKAEIPAVLTETLTQLTESHKLFRANENLRGLSYRFCRDISVELQRNTKDELTPILTHQFATFSETADERNNSTVKYFEQTVTQEVKLSGLLIEIRVHYGNTIYKKVKRELQPIYNAINNAAYLYDYDKITEEERDALHDSLTKEVVTLSREIAKEFEKASTKAVNLLL